MDRPTLLCEAGRGLSGRTPDADDDDDDDVDGETGIHFEGRRRWRGGGTSAFRNRLREKDINERLNELRALARPAAGAGPRAGGQAGARSHFVFGRQILAGDGAGAQKSARSPAVTMN